MGVGGFGSFCRVLVSYLLRLREEGVYGVCPVRSSSYQFLVESQYASFIRCISVCCVCPLLSHKFHALICVPREHL